jgi:putative PIN family toxin of toxin-antitoxin system
VRAIIDTNVLLSGLPYHGAPHALIGHVRDGSLTLISSPALLAGLADVIGRAKFDAILARSKTSREACLSEVRQLAEVIDPPPLPRPVCRDPDDDAVLALGVAAQVDLIVSGDEDLLGLGSYADVPIVNAADAVKRVEGAPR